MCLTIRQRTNPGQPGRISHGGMLCQDIRERQSADDAVGKVGGSKSIRLLNKISYLFVALDIADSGQNCRFSGSADFFNGTDDGLSLDFLDATGLIKSLGSVGAPIRVLKFWGR
jgi:hypothetical protein